MPKGGRRAGAGRPPGIPNIKTVADRLEMDLAFAEVFQEKKHEGRTPTFHITRLLIRRALLNDTAAIIHLSERYMGRVKYSVELEGNPVKPLEHRTYAATLDDGTNLFTPGLDPLAEQPVAAAAVAAVAEPSGNGGEPKEPARKPGRRR